MMVKPLQAEESESVYTCVRIIENGIRLEETYRLHPYKYIVSGTWLPKV